MHQTISKAEEIFYAALEFEDPNARLAYLDRVCSDKELRQRVEWLLAHDAQASSFLEGPASTPTAPLTHDSRSGAEEPGTVIGPYKLLEPIGEGGMGTVYMAEQSEPVRRRVALKLIKPGMDSKQVIARFEAERQALAMMDHPNIARVFDGGMTPSGRPYFVMELVRGLPITEYCDAHQLSIPERLELFVLVCRAVQHAHQKGIIHRDIKPSNVMVTVIDGVAVPKVIDFGVAKATGQALTDKTLFTGFHQFVGTPLYTSPEQADLAGTDVDTRSDIYSLGVLLYELLTGTTPFDLETLRKAAFDEMRRIIREEEPPRPSTRLSTLGETLSTVSVQRKADPRRLGASMKGELDWVVMKALEKDRRRRYETANDFAADVMRYLTDQPVEACPPSASYRLTKFVRRNRGALATGAVVSLALVLGTVISTWQAIRATLARQAEATQLQRAEAGEQQARANLKKAREAVDQMLLRVADRLENVPHMEQARRELLADAVSFYDGFLQDWSTDPEVRFETGQAYAQLGKMQEMMDEDQAAEKAFLQAVRIFQGLADEFPDHREARFNLAQAINSIGNLVREKQGRFSEAEQAYRRALEITRKLDTDFPGHDYRSWVAGRLNNLGIILHARGRLVEAEKTHREALAIRLVPPVYGNVMVESRGNLSSVLYGAGRFAEAELEIREVLEIQEERVARSPDAADESSRLASHYGFFGAILSSSGRFAEAEAVTRKGLAIAEKLATDFPTIPAYRLKLAGCRMNLGNWLIRTVDRAAAEAEYRETLPLVEKLAADFPDVPSYRWAVAAVQVNLGNLLLQTDRLPEAETALRLALGMFEALADENPEEPGNHLEVGKGLGTLGLVLTESGRLDEAETLMRRSLMITEKLAAEFPEVKAHRDALALSHGNLGIVLYRGGDWKAAVNSLEKWSELAGDPEEDGDPRFFLAMARGRLGDQEQAQAEFDRAARWTDEKDPFNPRLSRIRAEAAALLHLKDEPKPGNRSSP